MVPPLISLRHKWPIFYSKLKYDSYKKKIENMLAAILGLHLRWAHLTKYLYIRLILVCPVVYLKHVLA